MLRPSVPWPITLTRRHRPQYIESEREKFGREIDVATAEREVDEWLLKQVGVAAVVAAVVVVVVAVVVVTVRSSSSSGGGGGSSSSVRKLGSP